MNEKKKEPFFHVVKRDALPWYQSVGIRAVAIILALIVCGIVTTLTTGINPVEVYQSVFAGAFGTARKTWITLQNMSVLLLIALALTPAFKMKFWNIGGEGQVLIGGLAAAACMICLGEKVPSAVVIVCMVVSSVAAGAIWGFIPAFFKAKWNTNETLSTLMMNYIATQLVAFFTILWEVPKGIKVEKVIIRTVVLSGALCGLVGLLLVGSINHTITTTIAGGQGFTAVLVSWMSKFNPLTMVFATFLIIFMDRGASEISTAFGLNHAYSDILTGIILFFIIGCEFFITYRLQFRKKAEKEEQ